MKVKIRGNEGTLIYYNVVQEYACDCRVTVTVRCYDGITVTYHNIDPKEIQVL